TPVLKSKWTGESLRVLAPATAPRTSPVNPASIAYAQSTPPLAQPTPSPVNPAIIAYAQPTQPLAQPVTVRPPAQATSAMTAVPPQQIRSVDPSNAASSVGICLFSGPTNVDLKLGVYRKLESGFNQDARNVSTALQSLLLQSLQSREKCITVPT